MTDAEILALLHSLPIARVGDIRRAADEYISTWFGFSQPFADRRTPEWVEKAKWRLDGQAEPCCECGANYPRFDLHFHGEIYCPGCREKDK